MDGVPACAALFVLDSKRAYYAYGASDPELRHTEIGTQLMYESFVMLNKEYGVAEVDLVGVNSPQRGGFKMSFGGRLVPYFVVRKMKEREL